MGFKRETIEKWSLTYAILKPFVKLLYRIYFRIDIHNYKNIPKNEILVFAPNHQNALIDALVFVASTKGQHVFLGRADIFKRYIIQKLLTFIKILPIFRIRDGKENLITNNPIFNKTIDVLKAKR